MQLKVFSIRDTKAETYNMPFYQKSHGEAERSFKALTTDESSMISKYPEDFDLYFLGTYDDQTGQLTVLDTPQHIVKAINLKQ
ncbi:MAG: nonstructural protein [Microviridae sp.]|nr:MAG: nonstructural protein [Microviridae sp.]